MTCEKTNPEEVSNGFIWLGIQCLSESNVFVAGLDKSFARFQFEPFHSDAWIVTFDFVSFQSPTVNSSKRVEIRKKCELSGLRYSGRLIHVRIHTACGFLHQGRLSSCKATARGQFVIRCLLRFQFVDQFWMIVQQFEQLHQG